MSLFCVNVLGMIPAHSGEHRVSGSLVGAMHVPLHVLVALLCSAYRLFHVACLL